MNNTVSSDTQIVGISLIIKRKLRFIHKAANSDKSVLILGETGTGKDLTAIKIHELSDRRNKPFVAINCTDIPEELFEAELFGYLRGSFTGAVKDKLGLLEVAKNGTIFFDEIGDLSLHLQAKILRMIEKRELRRIGETTVRKIYARFIFATNKNLHEEVKAGRFRKDLYYRINVIKFYIPPLKERKEDIPLLVDHILRKDRKEEEPRKVVYKETLKILMAYDFPGNIRELENIVERACILSEGNIVTGKDIKLDCDSKYCSKTMNITPEQLKKTLENCRWNKTRAASKMGKSRRQFYRLLEKHKMSMLFLSFPWMSD
jgi:transcriptional regulator with PAS, ATPase and Fis domain